MSFMHSGCTQGVAFWDEMLLQIAWRMSQIARVIRDFDFSHWGGYYCSTRHDVHVALDLAHDLSL
jgi:hypothetical protein